MPSKYIQLGQRFAQVSNNMITMYCILAALTHALYHTAASDSESEAKYVRRQGRGLGIQPLAARSSRPCEYSVIL